MANQPKAAKDLIELPILPMREGVLFPTRIAPFSVGRPGTLKALQSVLDSENQELVVIQQKSTETSEPAEADLARVGTRASVREVSRLDEGSMEVLLSGEERVHLEGLAQSQPFLKGRFRPFPMPLNAGAQAETGRHELLELGLQVLSFGEPLAAAEIGQVLRGMDDPAAQLYLLASLSHPDGEMAQKILEASDFLEALGLVKAQLMREAQVLKVRRDVARQVQSEMGKEQREYLLRQNLRAIQEQLGEKNPAEAEVTELRKRLEKVGLPEPARKEAERELERLGRMPAASPEFGVISAYLNFVLELPWNKLDVQDLDLERSRSILDSDHFGLKDVKERILEHLAVLKLNPSAKAPILCFAGPPGVGKTSVGQSIARAMGRKFERTSLGGMHDEAELRGHRRTYIGALPGRILQAIRRAGTRNPVLMLDEVDKLGKDFRGDPAAALMEILDPDQNGSFRDNYLDLAFDLSKVFFITTANALEAVPQPLLDRMEVLRFPGYSNSEKAQIALSFLIPRELKQAGLDEARCRLSPQALDALIATYTREAGVRSLERSISSVFRKAALRFASGQSQAALEVRPEDLGSLLGPAPFFEETARRELKPGVAVGIAWTEAGGDVIYVESAFLPGSKDLMLTGQLGSVMQESAKAANTWVLSHAGLLGIKVPSAGPGVHLHVPAGATPKDGPSAGVTMAAALASLYTGLAARSDTAMTGEATLSGLLLPVGGIKEKVLAAHRAGLKRVVLPRGNERNLPEVPDHVRSALEFILVDRLEEALQAVLPGLDTKLKLSVAA
jgi:ATP-dependent Lon protease